MDDFKETQAKKLVRDIINRETLSLCSNNDFVYFGLPGRKCDDIREWKKSISYAYCCENNKVRYKEMQSNLQIHLPGKVKTYQQSIWDVMKNQFDRFIDLCNFDFCGGLSSDPIPEINELNSLSNFFSYQRKREDRSFLIAWTLGLRNNNFDFYKEKTLGYFQEAYDDVNKLESLENWITEKDRKMIRAYLYCIPCLISDYGKSSRYKIEMIDCHIYKKIMYFCLLKLTPSDDIITNEDRLKFIRSVFNKSYMVTNEDDSFDRLEYLL